jgi:hypothetical protein
MVFLSLFVALSLYTDSFVAFRPVKGYKMKIDFHLQSEKSKKVFERKKNFEFINRRYLYENVSFLGATKGVVHYNIFE